MGLGLAFLPCVEPHLVALLDARARGGEGGLRVDAADRDGRLETPLVDALGSVVRGKG